MSDWIEWKWTPEKPYPETLETRVLIKMDGNPRYVDPYPSKVGYWHAEDSSNFHRDCDSSCRITHYRIAEDKP